MTNGEEIIERRRAEHEALRAHYRDQTAEADRREAERLAGLPRLIYEPTGDPQPGVLYVLATQRIMAYDGQRAFVAAVRGQWVPEPRARALGLDGPAIALR